MGAFSESQAAYAAQRIATFPVTIDRGGDKRPAIRGWQRVGLPASKVLAERFPHADALGFCTGKRSGLTVLDVDTPDEKVLADALARHGETPVVIRSGSGHYQAWYKHTGETRRIRPDAAHPIDILGAGGCVVAPPSIAGRNRYQIVAGSLDDLDRLPAMRIGPSPTSSEAVTKGKRNNTLFRFCMTAAHGCESRAGLFQLALVEAATYHPPLGESEVAATVNWAWRKTERGENFAGAGRTVLTSFAEVDSLASSNPDAFSLLMILRRHHWNKPSFAIATKATAASIGWTLPKFRAALKVLVAFPAIVCVRPGGRGRGDPPLFAFA